MEIQKFTRKPFDIEAVQVTDENFDEVVEWAQGSVETSENGSRYIKVRVHYPLTPRQTRAFVGDWVLSSKRGYKVYTAGAFAANFNPSEKPTPVEPKSNQTLNTLVNLFETEDIPQELLTVRDKDQIGGKR